MARRDTDPPDVDEIARLIMSWMGLSMRLQRTRGEQIRNLADVGLTLQQIAALHVLRFEGAVSVTTLTERLGLSLSATSHLVQRLVEQGLATRVEDAKDRRQKVVELTAAGKTMVERMMKSRLDELRASVRHLSDAVRGELAPVLRHLVEELSGSLADAFVERGGFDWRACGSDLRHKDVAGADFNGAVILEGRFDNANLAGARMNGARLEGARFPNANLEGAELAGATLVDARFDNANLEGALLADADLSRARFANANLEGALLDGANLSDALFENANLEGTSFRGAVLQGARFRGCNLDGADFKGARHVPQHIGIERSDQEEP